MTSRASGDPLAISGTRKGPAPRPIPTNGPRPPPPSLINSPPSGTTTTRDRIPIALPGYQTLPPAGQQRGPPPSDLDVPIDMQPYPTGRRSINVPNNNIPAEYFPGSSRQARDPDEYRAEYGMPARIPVPPDRQPRPPAANGPGTWSRNNGELQPGPLPLQNGLDVDDTDVGRLQAKNRSLKVELEDHASRLELLKTDNDNLIQRLGDARKERERLEQELRDKARDVDRLRKQGGAGGGEPYGSQYEVERMEAELSRKSHALEQLAADKSQLADKVRRLEAELSRQGGPGGGLTGRSGGGGGLDDGGEARRLRQEVDRLEDELRRRAAAADELVSEMSTLKQTTVSYDRERELKAKVDRLTRELDGNLRRLQDAVNENERLKKTRIPAEIERELNIQIDKLTANIKIKERQIDELDRDVRKLAASKNEVEKNNAELQMTISDVRRELQRNAAEMDDLRDSRDRELSRLRADMDRLRSEKEEAVRAAIRDGHRTNRGGGLDGLIGVGGAGGGPSRPLQELVREQESHIADLRREVETLRSAVADYQKELERLRGMVDEDDMTREKFKDFAGAHRRLLDENARLLAMLDQRQQAEVKALTDKTDVVRNLTDTKKRLDAGNRRVAQLERWLDEIYNDKDFEVIQKRGQYSRAHTCRGGGQLPKMSAAAMSDRRKAEIRRLMTGGAAAGPTTMTGTTPAKTSKAAGCRTDRL